jgi:hypothetical protein
MAAAAGRMLYCPHFGVPPIPTAIRDSWGFEMKKVILVIALFGGASRCWALDFDYIKIADQSTVAPVAGGTFTGFDAPVVDGANVAFAATRSGYKAVLSSSGGTLTRVADTTMTMPGTASTLFTGFDQVAASGSNVAFRGTGAAQQGVYAYTGSLARVADQTTAMPGGPGAFEFFDGVTISGTTTSFAGRKSGFYGAYGNGGGLHAIVDANTPVPGGGGATFNVISEVSSSGHDLAFTHFGTLSGIYTIKNGAVQAAATTDTNQPNAPGKFVTVTSPSISNGGIAFTGFSFDQKGIYTNLGGTINAVADLSTPVPGGAGTFSDFWRSSLSNGNVAFYGYTSGGEGIYTDLGGALSPVAATGMVLDGKTIAGFPNGFASQGFSNGAAVFSATFSGGGQAVYGALSSYSFVANSSGSWDTAGNWSLGIKPRDVVGTMIHPANGALIMGPTSTTTLRELDLDTPGSGVAELRLQPTGQLNVNEYAYVQTHGKLNLNGGVMAVGNVLYNYGEVDLAGGQINGGVVSNLGVIHGSGTVANFVLNFGRIDPINAEQRFTSTVQNLVILDVANRPVAVGQINLRNSVMRFDGDLENGSQINFSGPSDVFGEVNNIAAASPLPGGQIIISGNSNVAFHDHVTNNGQLFRVSAGSTATFFGPVSGAGAFTGTGAKLFEGGYSPGNSPANVSLDGTVQFAPSNTLKIELGGTTSGTQYDKVSINGTLALGGILQVALINGFVPALGNSFDVLDWGTRTGAFSGVQLPALSSTLAWNAMQLNTTGTLSIVDVNQLPGDFNRDHQVTAADIPAMLKALTNLGAYQGQNVLTASQLLAIADLDLSGTITNSDIQMLLAIVSTLAGSGSVSAVPEPSSWMLALPGLLAAAAYRKRSRRARSSDA